MMNLIYDPGDPNFWKEIATIPGFPAGEDIRLKTMIFESGGYRRIGECLIETGANPTDPVLIVMDSTPMLRGTDSLKPLIISKLKSEGWRTETIVVPHDESGQVHAGMNTVSFVREKLRKGCSVVCVGSGSITDITKHACCLWEQENEESIPLVAYQTANSVTAFTSSMAVLFMNGVKRTVNSRYPDALLCDLETLRDAPYQMTVGGVGDMLAVFVSYPDWYLAYRFGIDPTFSEFALKLLGPVDEILKLESNGILNGSLRSIAVLAKLIALAGISMSLMQATTPLSGFEHVISHVLDMQAEVNNQPLAVHGTQVALASLMAVEVYRRFIDDFNPASVQAASCFKEPEEMRLLIENAFSSIDPSGNIAAECYSDYLQKLHAWNTGRELCSGTLQDWEAVCTRIQLDTRPLEALLDILRSVHSPLKWSDLTPPISEDQVKFAFMNAHLMRKRLTIGDLLFFFGWDRERLWNQVWERTQNLARADFNETIR
jgi:glycerol-1-phosphate dehydrogenase [NAD(P)+]